ncbi:hypothetical protein U1Q18_049254 [Sarracenia purpurea var. burkii]
MVYVEIVFECDLDVTDFFGFIILGEVTACMVAKEKAWKSCVKSRCLEKGVRGVVVELVVTVIRVRQSGVLDYAVRMVASGVQVVNVTRDPS